MQPLDPYDVDAYREMLTERIIGGDLEQLSAPIEIRDYDARWPERYASEAERIRSALGERVLRLEHAGSTSVPGLPAKPIIDIVLEVHDSRNEDEYVPDLEAADYILRAREPDWFEHRGFKSADKGVNLHVSSAGCAETERMVAFRNHLRLEAADRELYARVKRELATHPWTYMQQYADAKTAVVAEIMSRALAAVPQQRKRREPLPLPPSSRNRRLGD